MQLGRIIGIPIHLHWSFLGLMGIFGVSALVSGGVAELATTTVLEVVLFSTVLLHELGHAFAARGFGITTRDITLYPFGGVAALERMPQEPRQELVIAFAGPLVNLVLFTLFGAVWAATGLWVFAGIAALNALMGLFNLIPAFPMDGGRVLRAALALKLGWLPASEIAIKVGTFFAWTFVFGGAISGLWSFTLVGGFLLFALPIERMQLRGLSDETEKTSPRHIVRHFELAPRHRV